MWEQIGMKSNIPNGHIDIFHDSLRKYGELHFTITLPKRGTFLLKPTTSGATILAKQPSY